jgi:hypothetical protein
MGKKNAKTQVKVTGRPRNAFPVCESMKQAASLIGWPLRIVKAAKDRGSKAFLAGNRVDIGLLLPDLAEMTIPTGDIPPGFTSWKEFGDAQRAQLEAIELQRKRGAMMDIDDARRQAGEAMGLTFAELERLCNDLPPALAGLDAVAIFKRMTSDVERIRKSLKEKFSEVGK